MVVVAHFSGGKGLSFSEYSIYLLGNSFKNSASNIIRGKKSHPYGSPDTVRTATLFSKGRWLCTAPAFPDKISRAIFCPPVPDPPQLLQTTVRHSAKSTDLSPTNQVTQCPSHFCYLRQGQTTTAQIQPNACFDTPCELGMVFTLKPKEDKHFVTGTGDSNFSMHVPVLPARSHAHMTCCL